MLLFGLLISLSSCHLNHDYHCRALPLTCTDLQEQVEEAFASGSFYDDECICEQWWTLFGDPQLGRLIEMGLECNPDIAIADARIRLACEESMLERSTLYPHVDFDPKIWRHRVGEFASIPPPELGIFTEASLKLVGSWDLDIWNRNRAFFYASLDELNARWADRQEAELLLSTAIAAAYMDLQMRLIQRDLLIQMVEAKQEIKALQQLQLERGIIDAFPLLDTDVELALLEEQLEVLVKDISVAEHALTALIGGTCCADGCGQLVPPSVCLAQGFPLPCSLPLDLVARRPEITAQRWRIEAAGYHVHAAQASFYPNINLLGNIGYKGFRLMKLLQAPSLDAIGEIAGHLPIFNAGELQAKLGKRREEFEIAVEEYNQLILTAVEEVSDWISRLIEADRNLAISQRAVNDAEVRTSLHGEQFAHGIVDSLVVLASQVDLLIQKEILAQMQLLRLQAAVGLIRALGGGYYVE